MNVTLEKLFKDYFSTKSHEIFYIAQRIHDRKIPARFATEFVLNMEREFKSLLRKHSDKISILELTNPADTISALPKILRDEIVESESENETSDRLSFPNGNTAAKLAAHLEETG